MDQMQVLLTVTTDPAGVARLAVVAGTDEARLSDPVFRAFAERARRAVLDPRCGRLPLPQSMLGRTNVVTFRFSPYGQSGSPPPRTNATPSLPAQSAPVPLTP